MPGTYLFTYQVVDANMSGCRQAAGGTRRLFAALFEEREGFGFHLVLGVG